MSVSSLVKKGLAESPYLNTTECLFYKNASLLCAYLNPAVKRVFTHLQSMHVFSLLAWQLNSTCSIHEGMAILCKLRNLKLPGSKQFWSCSGQYGKERGIPTA